MKKLILVCTLYVLTFVTYAQTAAPTDTSAPKDPLKIKYLLSTDVSVTAGNLVSFTTVNKGQLELEKRVVGVKYFIGYRYGTIDTAVNSNELNTTLAISLFPKNRVYGFVNGGFETSFLRGFAYRGYGGLGAGFRVIKNDLHEFEPYVSMMYEYTKYDSPIINGTDTSNVLQTLRAVVGWTGLHKLFKKKLIITHYAKYQQSPQIARNFRFEGNISLALPIFKILSVKTGINYTYENVVLTGRKNSDFIWTFGVVLTNI